MKMMKNTTWLRIFPIVLGLMLTLAGCKPKIIFLDTNRTELEEAEVPLKMVQFYNDKEIILRRKASSRDIKESGGRMIEIDGDQIQEIRIRRNTPCIITGIKGNKLVVRFETGEGKTLRFYKNTKGAYQIDADEWISRRGQVEYAGLDFEIQEPSNDVLLLFREKRHFRSNPESRTIKGQKAHR